MPVSVPTVIDGVNNAPHLTTKPIENTLTRQQNPRSQQFHHCQHGGLECYAITQMGMATDSMNR